MKHILKFGQLTGRQFFGDWKILVSFITCLLLSSCAHDEEKFSEKQVNDLYTIAMDRFEGKEYKKAAAAFDEVERQHPYSDWSVQAELMSGYCYYLAKQYDEAIERFEGFSTLHPGHEKVAYALYMIGLCNYEQIPIVERDQVPAQEAKDAFSQILDRFGTSPYAKDARFKLHMVNDHLAAKEMAVGRYYQRLERSNIAAINRYKTVVEHYTQTNQTPEALYRLVECYLAEGIVDEAKTYAVVLGHNYRSSVWYKRAFALMATSCNNACPVKTIGSGMGKSSGFDRAKAIG